MRREFSVFLDLLRVAAALAVFLGHFSVIAGVKELSGFYAVSHSAVIVFFVLSGYLIAWTAQRDGNAFEYLVSRAARIYSVALPALILTYALDLSRGYITYQHLQPWKYVPFFLAFGTDFWFVREDAFSNIPWWSLCYEVWYYVLFGIMLFSDGWRRSALLLACLALVGPRLWLLFPIWLLGAFLHRVPRLPRPTLLLVIAIVLIGALKLSGLETILNSAADASLGGFPTLYLRYSRFFVGDYLFASLVALAIVAARDAELTFLVRWRKFSAPMAGLSFSLYLTHYPLLLAFKSVLSNPIAILISVLICVTGFGLLFERNKDVARRLIIALLAAVRVSGARHPTSLRP